MKLNNNSVMDNLVPTEFYLSQNYPIPFSEKTTIKFCVAYKTKVKLEVFNYEGNVIKILIDEEKEVGTYEIEFLAHNLPEGNYTYQLRVGDFLSTKNMTLYQE